MVHRSNLTIYSYSARHHNVTKIVIFIPDREIKKIYQVQPAVSHNQGIRYSVLAALEQVDQQSHIVIQSSVMVDKFQHHGKFQDLNPSWLIKKYGMEMQHIYNMTHTKWISIVHEGYDEYEQSLKLWSKEPGQEWKPSIQSPVEVLYKGTPLREDLRQDLQ
ncbi:hypothetical protein TI05_13595 [Achromatium sp. WMS3]|nr:hypothetical protein TI04_08275 [Achromatium sp. WMS2]KOR30679.1 hypothetical protein TI05_13595 [Achromatium sp. WMS3]